jgi:hypothetical protein
MGDPNSDIYVGLHRDVLDVKMEAFSVLVPLEGSLGEGVDWDKIDFYDFNASPP